VSEGEREAERLSAAPPPAEPPPKPPGQRLRGHLIDVGPLRRHRDFRLLTLGQSISFLGSMITYVAVPFQVYELTGSSLQVGLLGLVELVPILIMAFVGGALADAVDRRRMVRLTEGALLLASLVLLVNASLDQPRVWVLYVLAAVMAALDGLQRPSLEALLPRLVTTEELAPAVAIRTVFRTLGMVGGPPLGGILIAAFGLPFTYGVDVASFGVSLVALAAMKAVPPPPDADRPSLRSVLDGLRYAASRQELLGTYLVDIVAMLFGMPNALFPAMADRLGGPEVLGLLYAAPAVGSLLVSLFSGFATRVHRHGLAISIAASIWGLGIVAFGVAPNLPVALLGLVVAGGGDMISGLFRSTIWNRTPDRMRGRLAGIEMVSFTTGPLLGNVESGIVASLAGVRASVVSGGVLCIAGVIVTSLCLPRFLRYDDRRDAPDLG
jgi:MFS family permease